MSPDVFNANTAHKKHSHSTKRGDKSAASHHSKTRDPQKYSTVLAAEKKHRNGWSAYSALPEGISFETQAKD